MSRHARAAVRRARAAARALCAGLAIGALLAAPGCGLRVPEDPDGTLDRVIGDGVLEVGATVEEGLVEEGPDGAAEGPLADLAEGFADTVGARVEWTWASEESLVGLLERGRIDLAVGGFTDQTPWVDRVGVTRGYPGVPGAEGRSIVMLVPLGENRLLSALESHLDEEAGG